MRKEFKFLISGLISGFIFCFCLFILVITVSAAEVGELPEIVQDEQTEVSESEPQANDHGNVAADQLPQGSEIAVDVVQDEQIDLTAMIPADQLEMLDNWAQELDAAENDVRFEPFASGVIIGELADLLQENVIENDGYTEESWQRYEAAVAAGWDAISNFMIYTNDEVRAVIDELKASIAGLEYPAGKPPDFGNVELDAEYMVVLLCALGMSAGSVMGLCFMTKFQLGV